MNSGLTDWSKAPDWATWYAVDDDGWGNWYEDMPEPRGYYWDYRDESSRLRVRLDRRHSDVWDYTKFIERRF